MQIDDIFDNIEETKARQSTRYERAGRYLMVVTNAKQGESRKKRKFFAIEKTVLHVFQAPESGEGHKVGDKVSHLLMVDQEPTLPNIKSMIVNVFGVEENEVNKETCWLCFGKKLQPNGEALDVQSPLVGMFVRMNNYNIITRETQREITIKEYERAYTEEEVEEVLTDSGRAVLAEVKEQLKVPF